MLDDFDPDKNPVIKKVDDEVAEEIKRTEEALEQVDKRIREAQQEYDAGNRWPDPG